MAGRLSPCRHLRDSQAMALKTLAVAFSYSEAMLLVGKLKAYGIPAFAFSTDQISVSPPETLALGGIRIHVCEEDHALAMELIADDLSHEHPSEPEALSPWPERLSAFLLGLMGLVPPPRIRAERLDD